VLDRQARVGQQRHASRTLRSSTRTTTRDFRLSTKGQEQDPAEFRAGHDRVYPTPITDRVGYDEDGWVESGNRLAARVWITTQRLGEAATRIEVVLVVEYRDGRLL
jgi:hypothetical protein